MVLAVRKRGVLEGAMEENGRRKESVWMLQREWVRKSRETRKKLLQHVEARARGERHACIESVSV